MPTAQQWKNCGLVPTAGLFAWHMYETDVSEDGAIMDYSGNNRHLVCAGLDPPVITPDLVNGQPGWYFDGSKDPMVTGSTSTLQVKHVFALMAFERTAFVANEGLLSGTTSGDILASDNTGTEFFPWSVNYSYRKSGTLQAASDWQAPMDGNFALVEILRNDGTMDINGIQLGQQKADGARKMKGWFIESLLYSTEQNEENRRRIMLYFNLKFAQWQNGLPLYFPSDDLMQFRRRRFYAEPPQYAKITDSYEYEDGGKTFNEVADTPPRRWEYEYKQSNQAASTDPPEILIFDEFYNQARLANPFIFRDKYGTDWTDVRIEKYSRDHASYKPWTQEIKFDLIKYP